MVDKELIEIWRNALKPSISLWLLNTNYEEMGEQDKEEFERDFDEILDLALIGLKHKAQLLQEGTTKDATSATSSTADTISRQAAIDAIMGEHPDAHYPDWYARIIEELPPARPKSDRNTGDLVERQAVLDLARDLTFKNIEGLKHYRYRCIDPDHVRELKSVQLTEAIPVSWIEAKIARFMSMDNDFAGLTANIIKTMLNEWRKEARSEREHNK